VIIVLFYLSPLSSLKIFFSTFVFLFVFYFSVDFELLRALDMFCIYFTSGTFLS